MKRRRAVISGAAFATLPLLGACGGGSPPPPPPPTLVSVTIKAATDVNPDASGTPKPIRVRVLKLKSAGGFAEADFFALDKDPSKVLGGDLLGMDQFVVAPGGTQVWQAKLDDDTHTIGVMAAYYDIDKTQWRAWKDVPKNATTLLTADVGAKGVALREAGL